MKFLMIAATIAVLAVLVQFARARHARGADRSRWKRINAEAVSNMTRAQERRSETTTSADPVTAAERTPQ